LQVHRGPLLAHVQRMADVTAAISNMALLAMFAVAVLWSLRRR
jgi:MYXO-CTERM domain-containing protein